MRFRPEINRPFPDPWRELLDRWVSFYRHLAQDRERHHFERNVQRIVDAYQFIAMNGEPADARAMLLIAAGAAVLLHGRPTWQFPGPQFIRIRPAPFRSGQRQVAGVLSPNGDLEFSTEDLFFGWEHPSDGYNVALHEFAHVLDRHDGQCDGIPSMLPPQAIGPWLELLGDEISKLRRGSSVLDRYAATNRTELFAVAVETFYERPNELQKQHRLLYDALRELFAVDPVQLYAAGPRTLDRP